MRNIYKIQNFVLISNIKQNIFCTFKMKNWSLECYDWMANGPIDIKLIIGRKMLRFSLHKMEIEEESLNSD